ncbi:MAG: hypothetical protein ACRD5R_13605 [Candidatus Acidiferrales bacterium]
MMGQGKRGMRKEVGHGGIVPRGWRMGWYEPRRRVGTYFPSPLHWIVRTARECAYRARLAWRAPSRECAEVFAMERTHRERQRLADEYARGYMAGWRECFAACLEAVQEEMARSGDVWDAGAMLLPEGEGKEKTRKN